MPYRELIIIGEKDTLKKKLSRKPDKDLEPYVIFNSDVHIEEKLREDHPLIDKHMEKLRDKMGMGHYFHVIVPYHKTDTLVSIIEKTDLELLDKGEDRIIIGGSFEYSFETCLEAQFNKIIRGFDTILHGSDDLVIKPYSMEERHDPELKGDYRAHENIYRSKGIVTGTKLSNLIWHHENLSRTCPLVSLHDIELSYWFLTDFYK